MDPIIGAFLGLLGFALCLIAALVYFIYAKTKKHMLKMKLRKAFFQTDERYEQSLWFRFSVNLRIYTPTIVSLMVVVAIVTAANRSNLGHNSASTIPAPYEPEPSAPSANDDSMYESSDVRLLRMQADNGEAVAQNELGVRYFNGNGVKQDFTKSLHYFKKAAQKGDLNAMNNLGRMYKNGFGAVKASPRKAIIWFTKSANRDDADACYELACIYNGEGEFYSAEKAMYWCRKASDGGNHEAQEMLAKLSAEEKSEQATKETGAANEPAINTGNSEESDNVQHSPSNNLSAQSL